MSHLDVQRHILQKYTQFDQKGSSIDLTIDSDASMENSTDTRFRITVLLKIDKRLAGLARSADGSHIRAPRRQLSHKILAASYASPPNIVAAPRSPSRWVDKRRLSLWLSLKLLNSSPPIVASTSETPSWLQKKPIYCCSALGSSVAIVCNYLYVCRSPLAPARYDLLATVLCCIASWDNILARSVHFIACRAPAWA